MLKFLKKKTTNNENTFSSETSLDDLPPAPKPNSATTLNYASNEPYIPPVPDEEKSMSSDNQKPIEELEPLPESPIIHNDVLQNLHKEEEISEPKPISQDDVIKKPLMPTKPVSPKDIDPRDHFDDLIKPNQGANETVTKDESPISPSNPANNSSWSLGSGNKPQIKISEDYFADYKENMELPSAEELAQVLKPKEQINTNNKISNNVLPPKIPDYKLNQAPIQESKDLPTFENPQIKKAIDPDFALPEVHFGMMPQKELAIYVSINDYALVTQNMRKLMKFFKSSGKMLNQADNPEKVHVINELYKELNNAQKKLMDIDKKLFERDSYGA